jgi:hypothetical protein
MKRLIGRWKGHNMSSSTLETKTGEEEHLRSVSDKLVEKLVDAVNEAAQSGLSLCHVTRAMGILLLTINLRRLGNIEQAAEHVGAHLDEAYDVVEERQVDILKESKRRLN